MHVRYPADDAPHHPPERRRLRTGPHLHRPPAPARPLRLGRDLSELARNYPLLLFLDTYEEIDEADWLLRIVMAAVGPRVGWVLAGRDNLWAGPGQRESSPSFEYGYKDLVPADRGLPINFNDGDVGAFTISILPQKRISP